MGDTSLFVLTVVQQPATFNRSAVSSPISRLVLCFRPDGTAVLRLGNDWLRLLRETSGSITLPVRCAPEYCVRCLHCDLHCICTQDEPVTVIDEGELGTDGLTTPPGPPRLHNAPRLRLSVALRPGPTHLRP